MSIASLGDLCRKLLVTSIQRQTLILRQEQEQEQARAEEHAVTSIKTDTTVKADTCVNPYTNEKANTSVKADQARDTKADIDWETVTDVNADVNVNDVKEVNANQVNAAAAVSDNAADKIKATVQLDVQSDVPFDVTELARLDTTYEQLKTAVISGWNGFLQQCSRQHRPHMAVWLLHKRMTRSRVFRQFVVAQARVSTTISGQFTIAGALNCYGHGEIVTQPFTGGYGTNVPIEDVLFVPDCGLTPTELTHLLSILFVTTNCMCHLKFIAAK